MYLTVGPYGWGVLTHHHAPEGYDARGKCVAAGWVPYCVLGVDLKFFEQA